MIRDADPSLHVDRWVARVVRRASVAVGSVGGAFRFGFSFKSLLTEVHSAIQCSVRVGQFERQLGYYGSDGVAAELVCGERVPASDVCRL